MHSRPVQKVQLGHQTIPAFDSCSVRLSSITFFLDGHLQSLNKNLRLGELLVAAKEIVENDELKAITMQYPAKLIKLVFTGFIHLQWGVWPGGEHQDVYQTVSSVRDAVHKQYALLSHQAQSLARLVSSSLV